ncbi:Neutral/alkaline non-lysosomal ceramidase [Anatilimnocola aggregata]|uniref:Neutral/alkaline non-lysosomal ceramidase n=1 Tax=Anatilimnocola aggregata TaxID=2528021 RepID=A0A517YBT1_9BACT|nr:hypothetical protein [Anatilimnocola aggregata]QDU27713.1 Neutral/alkaline non-lysosomal ceramidase [Anatilimnocola aggregata]
MFQAGVARREITPFWGVELTGWGYYIERRWRQIADPLFATALVMTDGEQTVVLITLDLMLIDEAFTRRTRELITGATGIPGSAIMLTCSHSHNAPAAGGLRGVGECHPLYEHLASQQAATAAILAWKSLEPARVAHAQVDVPGISFNRTRPAGVVDSQLTLLRINRVTQPGHTLAMVANYGAHPTLTTQWQPWSVSRDIPGVVCDGIEAAFPGSTALYVQGACGDANFLREYISPDRYREPAEKLIAEACDALRAAHDCEQPTVAAAQATVELPTRRWTREEIEADRREAERRMADDDIRGWRETIGRSMTNRPDDMVRRHDGDERKAVRAMCRFHLEWTELMLQDWETRPEVLPTEVQALRVGELYLVANSSEFFSPFAIEIRQRAEVPALMFACYANGRIGYLPDAHDIVAKSYAGYQSPKYCNQFPFTADSGPVMCNAMLSVIQRVKS